MEPVCFECGNPAPFQHHVIPRSFGGIKTVPLCGTCHGKIHHGQEMALKTDQLIRDALDLRRKQGKKLGGKVPYGYEVGKERVLVPVKTEQKGLGIILNGHKQGLSMAAIAEKLTEAGIQTKNGGKWYPGTVYQILERQEKA